MSNVQKPASATAKVQKLLLFPGDPLIKILKPDYYRIVEPGSFGQFSDTDPEDQEEEKKKEEEEENFGLKAPSLSDITLVSKTMVTDKNKNQFVKIVSIICKTSNL